jgi:hypothetical protein
VDENASSMETSMTSTAEELMKKLEKLNAELTKLKTKDDASSSKDDDSSFEEEVSKKWKKEKKKHNKSSYNAMYFNYDSMPSSTANTAIPVGKAPYFDGSNCNQ